MPKLPNILPQIATYRNQSILLESGMPREIKQTTASAIRIVKQVALQHKIVSLSANQVDLQERFFVCLKDEFLVPGKWRNYTNLQHEDQYEAIINPTNMECSDQLLYAPEQCPSFEGLKFLVWAPTLMKLTYHSENDFNKKITKRVKGFKSRVYDHQVRHLEGMLPIYEKICKGQFFLLDDYKDSFEAVDYYNRLISHEEMFLSKNLKEAHKKFEKELVSRQGNPLEQIEKLRTFKDKFQNYNEKIPKDSIKQNRKPKKNSSKTQQEIQNLKAELKWERALSNHKASVKQEPSPQSKVTKVMYEQTKNISFSAKKTHKKAAKK